MWAEPVVLRPDRPVAPGLLRAWEVFAPRIPRWLLRWIARGLLTLPRRSRARGWFVLNMAAIAWDAVREVLDGGDTWVLRVTASGRGAASGAPTQADVSCVSRLNPLLADFRNFADDAAALREAGFA